jgi:protochlorophyllide reductase
MVDGVSPFNADKAYKDSKLCNVLFAREAERRLRELGHPLPVTAWSPGLVIPRSPGGFFRRSRVHNEWGQRLFALVARDLLRLTESVENAGVRLAAFAGGASPLPAGFSYFSNRVLGPGRLRFEAVSPSAEALDDAKARELWTLSARVLGTEGLD